MSRVGRIDALNAGRHQQHANAVLAQCLGIARHVIDGPLGQNLALRPHGAIDAVQASLGSDDGRVLEIQFQLLINLAEDRDRRNRVLRCREGGRDSGELRITRANCGSSAGDAQKLPSSRRCLGCHRPLSPRD